MKKIPNIILFAMAGLLLCACHADVKVADYAQLSNEEQITYRKGDPFRLRRKIDIIYPAGNTQLHKEAEFLAGYLKRKLKLRGNLQTDNARRGIILDIDTTLSKPESYRISINAKHIRISGRTEKGVWEGIRVLRRTMPAVKSRRVIFIPAADIAGKD